MAKGCFYQSNSGTQLRVLQAQRHELQHHRTMQSHQCVKTLSTRNCVLCNKEKAAVLEQLSRVNPQLLVNSNIKMCGVCQHEPQFHRHAKQTVKDDTVDVSQEAKGQKQREKMQ